MRPRRNFAILACLLFGLAVSACESAPEPTAIPIPATATPAPPSPTATPMATPTMTSTPTKTPTLRASGSPTATPRPSITPSRTATPSPTATLRPSATPSPTATPTQVPPDWQVQTLLVGPGQPGRLYALQSFRDPSPDTNRLRLLVSGDSGATWKPFEGGLPTAPSCLHNINLDYAVADTLYASTCQGLFRWSGNKWSLVSSQETGMVAMVYQQSDTIWATGFKTSDMPILRSNDGGKTWNTASSGMVYFSGIANLGIDPRDSNTLYAIINPKYAGSYLRRGTASGQWQTIPTPLKNAQIDTGMTIDGATGALYVMAYDSRDAAKPRWQLWRSANANESDIGKITWEMIHDFGAGVSGTVLASGPSPQGLAIYARLSSANCNPGAGIPCQTLVQRSLDGGKTWATLDVPGF